MLDNAPLTRGGPLPSPLLLPVPVVLLFITHVVSVTFYWALLWLEASEIIFIPKKEAWRSKWREMSSFINCWPPTVINSTGSEPRPINLAVIAMLLFTWISSFNRLIMSYWALQSRESSWTCLPPSPSPCWAPSVGRTQSLHHIIWISLKIK